MQGQGLLVSNEIHPARAKILSENIERMGIRNALVTNETPACGKRDEKPLSQGTKEKEVEANML